MLRWIVRRTRPSRRQARNLTAFEKATGWRYSIIVTNIPAARLWSLPARLVRHARQRILKLSFRVLQPLPVPALTDRTFNDAAGFASC